jgi:hypothetical protein
VRGALDGKRGVATFGIDGAPENAAPRPSSLHSRHLRSPARVEGKGPADLWNFAPPAVPLRCVSVDLVFTPGGNATLAATSASRPCSSSHSLHAHDFKLENVPAPVSACLVA